jgi:ribonuclease HI
LGTLQGAGIIITSPTGQYFNFSYRLEFEETNNIAEYESLLLGLGIVKDMRIKIFNTKGDSDLDIPSGRIDRCHISKKLKQTFHN